MKFQPLSEGYEIPTNAEEEFRSSRAIGPVRIGAETFYFKKGELAQIQLPGEKAGKALLEELKKLIPDAQFGKPGAQAPSEA